MRRAVPERAAGAWSRNSFHVTAVGDTDDCAQRILRSFVRSPGRRSRAARRCADDVRAGACPGGRSRARSRVASARSAGRVPLRARRTGRAAALTVADLLDRWWNNYSGSGVGLRGGTLSYTGDTRQRCISGATGCSRAWPSAATPPGTATGTG